ncbi:hypothetical protein AB0G67_40700 [Streptomyces sp. NPDC021056]|uniref:hypothetical protein n=1 Tax=Streptomyces sp. NPDC021056 TaxID=3155012 RepID=UPI0033D15988
MTGTRDCSWVRHWSELLQYDEVWRDGQGRILRLDDMDPGYCGRVRAFCLRQADHVYELIGMEVCSGPEPSGYQAGIDFERAFDEFLSVDSPTAWLEQSPLLIALKYRSEGLPARPTVCHCGYPFTADGLWDHSACYPGIVVD